MDLPGYRDFRFALPLSLRLPRPLFHSHVSGSSLGKLAPLIERIAHHGPDLARLLERASRSVALNTAEGMYARGRSKTAAHNAALREMREAYSALEVSVRLRYLRELAPAFEDRSRRILGTLYRLSYPA